MEDIVAVEDSEEAILHCKIVKKQNLHFSIRGYHFLSYYG